MSGSNIFMQLITATGPVLGEGLLEGFEGSIELKEFGWGMDVDKESIPNAPSSLAGRLGGAMKGAMSILGLGTNVRVQMKPLTFTKRFDTASSQIHICLDNHLPVLSASITVLHIKQGGRFMHQPGFMLVATQGYFSEVKVEIQSDGNMAEVVEHCTLNFKNIVITYLKTLGKDNIPTAPFFYPNPISI